MSNRLSDDLASLRIEASAPRAPHAWPRARGLALLLVACALSYLVVAPYVGSVLDEAEPEPAPAPRRSADELAAESDRVELTASGYVVPRVSSKVGAKVDGRIERVFVGEGDFVNAGDPLFVLDVTTQEARLSAAKARLAAARARAARQGADLAEGRRKLKLEQRLLDAAATTRASVEDMQGQVRVLGHTRAAARADLAEAEATLDELALEAEYRTIRAPIDGHVITKPADMGEVVSPLSPALLELVDLSSVVVEVDVPESRLGKVVVGGSCTIVLDAYPDRRYRGAVAAISPVINRAKATVSTRIRFVESHEGALPNMAARVSFLASRSDTGAHARRVVQGPPVDAQVVNNPPDSSSRGPRVEENTRVR